MADRGIHARHVANCAPWLAAWLLAAYRAPLCGSPARYAVRQTNGRKDATVSATDQRQHAVGEMTTYELERAKRDLAASLALAEPGSPVCVPIERQLSAIDAEQQERERMRHR